MPPRKILGLTLSSSRSGPFYARLRYSYSVEGQTHSGELKREFLKEVAAREFVRDLQSLPVLVHYDPNQPSRSVLLDTSVDALLRARPPRPEGGLAGKDSIPRWLRPLLWPFAALSAVGLVVSLWVHLGALLGRRPAEFYWIMHVGIFVVWFPAVLVAQKRVGETGRKDYWKAVLRGSPPWMLYMVYAFLAYAVVNFLFFMINAPTGKDTGADTPPEVWRGFSGHWMAFYSAAFAILYSAARENSFLPRCVNGHPMRPGEALCSECGQPVDPFR